MKQEKTAKQEKKEKTQEQHRPLHIALWSVLFGLLLLIGVALFSVCIWYKKTYAMDFKELLYTLVSPLKGTGKNTIHQILSSFLPWVLLFAVLFTVAAILLARQGRVFRFYRRIGAAACSLSLIFSMVFTCFALGIPEYLKNKNNPTTIYEDYYVNPADVNITAQNGQGKNLIYIYLESMETTYASVEEGGAQNGINYIPEMTELVTEGISFTDDSTGLLGGFHTPSGTTWTIAALLATTAGIPFAFPVNSVNVNNLSNYENFAPGLTALGDILAEKGYTQEFLCGSDSVFGGRRSYFEEHGNYKIFDYYTAVEKGYIEDDYYVFWGYEDAILYEIAKDELTRLSSGEQPFNFTMLTVDPHHVDGYVCNLCEQNEEMPQLEKVLRCADRQLVQFIEWCKTQDFYQDTTIIITGDHPRMDKTFVEDVAYYDRTIYNCFLNSATQPLGETVGRICTSFDIFPSVLAAMGFTVEGNRLGLGVNLFSTEPTLAEQLGYDYLNQEVSKYSEYYISKFCAQNSSRP